MTTEAERWPEMLIPGGLTCGDCHFWERTCSRLMDGSKSPDDRMCDFSPIAFKPKGTETANAASND